MDTETTGALQALYDDYKRDIAGAHRRHELELKEITERHIEAVNSLNHNEVVYLGDGDGNLTELCDPHEVLIIANTLETPLPAGYHYRYEPRAGDQTIVVRHIVKGNKALCGKVRQGQLAMVYGGDTILCRGCGWQMEIDTS